MKAINLMTEHLINPIGIDFQHPVLMWNCESGKEQSAYRIVARSEGKTVWDSGKVLSADMYVPYPDKLASRQRIEWAVTVWDESDIAGETALAYFEMGLLSPDDFKARWITGNYKVNKKTRYPVDCFKKVFSVESVQKARLYITACGLYEARLNGEKVGNFCLAPGHTDTQSVYSSRHMT